MAIGTLDYKPAKLVMEMTNQVEQAYRINAVQKEPWTVEFIESVPEGSVFWDIGANTGPYTLIAAHRGLLTVAIEPAANNYAALCRNLAMNNLLDRCIVLCLAVADSDRFDWFHYQDMRQGAASHVLGGERKQFFHKQLMQVLTWDKLFTALPLPQDKPHYAKVDVDGGELLVLKGASTVLRNPALQGLVIEMHEKFEEEMAKLLAKAGWNLAARFDEREGKSMGPVAYGRFERG